MRKLDPLPPRPVRQRGHDSPGHRHQRRRRKRREADRHDALFVGFLARLADEIEDRLTDFARFRRRDVRPVEPAFEHADGQFDVVLDLVRQAGLIERKTP